VYLWERTDRPPRRPKPAAVLDCPGVRAACFSQGGGSLLALGTHGAHLWDLRTRQPLGLPLPVGGAEALAWFSADGRQVLSADGANVRLWPVPVPVADRAGAVALWVQLRAGLELDEDGAARPLDEPARQEKRRSLEGLLGL
jgi:hypothetical protein